MVFGFSAKDKAKQEYSTIQSAYDKILNTFPYTDELAKGKLPWANLQNLISQYWLVVGNFPVYLKNLANKAELEKIKNSQYSGQYNAALDWLGESIPEEKQHRELWEWWAKESDVSLGGANYVPEMVALHKHLMEISSSEYVPFVQAIGQVSVGIEGATGILIKRVYDKILIVHELANGKKLSARGKMWLEVHYKEDLDKHPVEALHFVRSFMQSQEQYQKIVNEILRTVELYYSAFNAAASRPYEAYDKAA